MQPKKRNVDRLAALVGLLAIIAMGGAIWGALSISLASNNPGQVTPGSMTMTAPLTTVPPSPLDMTATAIQQATQDAVATIVALKQQDATARALELTTSPFPSPLLAPTGIYDDERVKAQWAKEGFIVQNAWFGLVNGNSVVVYAGAIASDPDQGIIHVVLDLPYREFQQRYSTSEKHGSLRITDEQNNRLTLVSTDGTTFYFDVPGLQFASSLTEVVPTAAPPPTYTPMPTIEPPSTALPPTAYPYPVASPSQATPVPTAPSTASP